LLLCLIIRGLLIIIANSTCASPLLARLLLRWRDVQLQTLLEAVLAVRKQHREAEWVAVSAHITHAHKRSTVQ
jgi:hypothetical protein